MSSTYYHFIPSLREGLTTAIITTELETKATETIATAKRVEIDVRLNGQARNKNTGQFEPIDIPPQRVQLYGPGDVLGFSSRIVTRTEPKNHAGNFEPNYFPFIEFSEPDFLWRFTPKKAADGHGSLDPWVTLIVLIAESKDKEFAEETQAGTTNIPRISGISKSSLPDLEYAWQWAHVQVTSDKETLNAADVADIMQYNPEQAVCRLMCARKLRPKTLYHAFVVPTFKLGLVAAGIIDNTEDAIKATDKSWIQDGSAEEIMLPYYYKWEFRTSVRGDFEYLVRLLEPRKLAGLGTRPMDCETPGYGIAGVDRSITGVPEEAHILKLEGALQSLETEYTPWGNDSGAEPPALEPFQEEIADKLLNKTARDLGSIPDSDTSKRFTYTVADSEAITNISLKLQSSDSSVRFEWNTAQESISRIEYGLAIDERDGSVDCPVLRTAHVITLTGLTPHNTYYFKISGTNPLDYVEGTFDLPELPSVVPPIYGKWHRAQSYVDTSKPSEWLSALNLDPRHRAAAGLGSLVIKKQQEALMASAWEQIGDVLKANKMLRQAQVGRDTGKHMHTRMKNLLLERFLYFSAPVQKRVTMENPCSADDSTQPKKISIEQFIKKNTEIPAGIMDPAFRRIGRVRGPIRKRQKRSPLREDLLTRLAGGTLEPAGSHPRPGGMFTPCMISHILSERMQDLVPPLPKNYTLVVNAGTGGSVAVTLPDNASYEAGTAVTVKAGENVRVAAKPSENCTFDKWSGGPINESTNSSESFQMNGDYSITAIFKCQEPGHYSLTVNVINVGSVKVNDNAYTDAMTIEEGQEVTVKAAPLLLNHDFAYWSGEPFNESNKYDPEVSFTMNDNYTITAYFTDPDSGGGTPGGGTDTSPGGSLGTRLSAGVNPTPPSAPGDTAGLTGSSDRGLQPGPGPAVTITAPPSGVSASGGIIPGISRGNATLFCEDEIKKIDVAQFIEEHKPFNGINALTDPEATAKAVEDALKNWLNKVDPKEPKKIITRETLEKIRGTLDAELDPEHTITERVKKRLRLSESIAARFAEGAQGDSLDAIMAAPIFFQPMYEPLRDISQDLLLPGVETVPQNTIAMLQTNRRFMESYMVGCNHEFAGELLWRRYPTDQRGSYFRQFWDVSEYVPKPEELDEDGRIKKELLEQVRERLRDIERIHKWQQHELGGNSTCQGDVVSDAPDDGGDNIVLLVRGDLLNRYPNTVIYAVDAVNTGCDETNPILRPAMQEFLAEEYLFSWNDIPGNDSVKLVRILKQRYGVNWAATTGIEKIEDDRTIQVSSGENILYLRLNDDNTVVSVEIDDDIADNLITKTEDSKLNIYLKDKTSLARDPYFPLFKGSLSPDLTFLGFPFNEDKARGKDGGHGVYFIFEERVSETRFGLDAENNDAFDNWDDISWETVELGSDEDIGQYIAGTLTIELSGSDKAWTENSSSAQRAWITMQKPVRIAVHSSQLLPKNS